MEVEAAEFGNVQDRGGQERSVGDDHEGIGREVLDRLRPFARSNALGLEERKTQTPGRVSHRRRPQARPAAGGTGRIRDDANDLDVIGLGERFEGRDRPCVIAEERYLEAGHCRRIVATLSRQPAGLGDR